MSDGIKAAVAISFQNSYGTALVNSRYWAPILSEGLSLAKEPLISQSLQGRFDEGATYEGLNTVEGDIEMEANPIALGAVFKAIFGNPTSVQSAGIYTHTYKPRADDFDKFAANIPLTITKDLGEGGSMHHFYDMVASKISMGVANGEFFKATLSVMGGKYTQVAAVAPSFPTGQNWTWDVTSITLATSAQGDLADLTIDFDENLENRHTLGLVKTPSRTKRAGFRSVSIAGTLLFDDQLEYQQFLSQSERELIVNLRGTTEIQSGYFEDLTIKLPLFRYAEFGIPTGGPGQIEVGFSAKGIYSVSSATMMEVTLVNTQPAY